jgi:5-methylcytosine-specific restriction endonuclease McrA
MDKEEEQSNCRGEKDTSLMGYSRRLFEEYNYTCIYCHKYCGGSFEEWMQLTREHVIPYTQLTGEDQKYRNDKRNLRVACKICNNMRTRANFDKYKGMPFEERIDKIIEEKRKIILKRRSEFEKFYNECIRNRGNK